MTKAVLDVNILISGLFWKGPSRRIVDFAVSGHIESITSPDILAELEAVLHEDFSDIPYTIDARISNRNMVYWFHETPWNPNRA